MSTPLGKRLKAHRIHGGLSLRELSGIVGVSFATLSRIERGASESTPETAERIERWLVTGAGSAKPERRKGRPWIMTVEQRLARIERVLKLEPEEP